VLGSGSGAEAATGVLGGAGDAPGVTCCAVARRSGEAAASAVAPAASDRTRRRETEAVPNELGIMRPPSTVAARRGPRLTDRAEAHFAETLMDATADHAKTLLSRNEPFVTR
jgi:hypothetical protein